MDFTLASTVNLRATLSLVYVHALPAFPLALDMGSVRVPYWNIGPMWAPCRHAGIVSTWMSDHPWNTRPPVPLSPLAVQRHTGTLSTNTSWEIKNVFLVWIAVVMYEPQPTDPYSDASQEYLEGHVNKCIAPVFTFAFHQFYVDKL